MVSAPEWQMVRATALDVAEPNTFTGYACDRFSAWELCSQRQSMGTWPRGTAMVRLSMWRRQQELMAGLPAWAMHA
jgi:hypothetical protein